MRLKLDVDFFSDFNTSESSSNVRDTEPYNTKSINHCGINQGFGVDTTR